MGILNANCANTFANTFEKLQNTIKRTKLNLGQLDVLSDSIKSAQINDLESSKTDVVLSSLCTKWKQFNVGLQKFDRINATTNSNDIQNQTNTTANQLTMYSILDELKLNDSKKPSHTTNGETVRKSDYMGLGFISHIVNESSDILYITDVQSMPDPLILYGAVPKRLTRTPVPGEMFAYVYQEKYMVRAVRLEYEPNSPDHQYSALFVDIGCVVRISTGPNELYEVTQVAKSIPPYAKMCRLIRVPDDKSIFDLLHTRVHYKVICNDNSLMLIDVIGPGVNPFAIEHQNEWNFYMYFFDMNKATSPSILPSKQNDFNPFNGISTTNMPQDKSELAEKSMDVADNNTIKNDDVSCQLKLNDFNLDKTTSRLKQNDFNPFNEISIPNTAQAIPELVENKDAADNFNVKNDDVSYQLKPNIINLLQRNYKITSFTIEPLNRSLNPFDANIKTVEMNNNISHTTDELNENLLLAPKITPTKSIINKNQTQPRSIMADFVKPKKLQIGQKLKLLYQHMISVEEFYASLPNDSYKMKVDKFSIYFNKKMYTRHLEPYTDECTPMLYDKVVAMYNATDAKQKFYRAKVVGVIDKHVFRVFYVDYGNYAKVKVSQIFKYNSMWDEYPEYVMHFRLNRIKECKPWDYLAKRGIEQIMRAECSATVVGIEFCEKLKRTTYVVDLRDENRLDVASTLFKKNLALLDETPIYNSACSIVHEETTETP
ncbi:uncharacterized protein LOC116339147 isoform X2 [Contarinia nasturtii]|nr:uncharacterized protein LOC116339147 isoform X2 [Contarinia nasturtii]